jgi:putative hydrolase of the HAD superfamily
MSRPAPIVTPSEENDLCRKKLIQEIVHQGNTVNTRSSADSVSATSTTHLRYDAVIFDLFGTLIDFLPNEEYRKSDEQIALALSAPVANFRRLWLGTLHDRNAGNQPTMNEEVLHVCRRLGLCPDAEALAEANERRLDIMRLNLKPKMGAIETLSGLRALGCKTCLLSDCPMEIPALWPETPFADLMDAAVFSCDERITKPNPDLYEAACSRLGVIASRCLYVGDGGSFELTGAAEFGMNPILIRTAYGPEFVRYQPEADVWTGPAISDLTEILGLVNTDSAVSS